MKKTFIAVLALAVVAAAGLAIGIFATRATRGRAKSSAAATQAPAPIEEVAASSESDAVKEIRLASNPTPAPPFLMNDLDGNIITSANWRGKVILVNFWATWCPPCREELPQLISLQKRYGDRLQIIGVSMDADIPPEEVNAFAHHVGINYPIVMGEDLAPEYGGIPALPTSFLVNAEGKVVQKNTGLQDDGLLETEVRAVLGLPVKATVDKFEDTGQIFLKNATELPGVSFKGLTAQQKQEALKRLNSEMCTCGCNMTVAECRFNDEKCATSKSLAEKVVKQVLAGQAAPAPASPESQ